MLMGTHCLGCRLHQLEKRKLMKRIYQEVRGSFKKTCDRDTPCLACRFSQRVKKKTEDSLPSLKCLKSVAFKKKKWKKEECWIPLPKIRKNEISS